MRPTFESIWIKEATSQTSFQPYVRLLRGLVSLSDTLMLSIPTGDSTEPSADKKTMLTAAHRFLPGALRGGLQAVSEFTGFSQSVVLY